VTRDRARKKAVRARMAASGEPYSVAARNLTAASLGATDPPSDPAAVREIIACANRTLAAPSARIEFRIDWESARAARQEPRRRPGPLGRLARLAARTALQRIAPGMEAAEVRDAFAHQVGAGFLEPGAGRYLIDYGAYAEMCVDGKHFGGLSGASLEGRRPQRSGPWRQSQDPVGLLRLLQGVTDARYADGGTVHGTPCRTVAVRAGSAGLTVWIDDEHIRRVQSAERAPGASPDGTKRLTLELWEFGVPVGSLDWSRLPSFRTGHPS
jgi:hypothetical protein